MRRTIVMIVFILTGLLPGSALSTESRAWKPTTSRGYLAGQAKQAEQARALNNDPIAHYQFEGDATDSSGNGHHATASSGVTYAQGWDGQAAYFGSGADIRITIPDDDQLDTDYQFTISAWVEPTQYRDTAAGDNHHVIFSKWQDRDEFGDYHFTLTAGNEPGRLWFRVANTENGFVYEDLIGSSDYAVPLNKWSHIAAVFDNGAMNVYLDCELAASKISETVLHTELNEYNHDEINLGNLWTNQLFQYGFVGGFDEARIYNRPLSKLEICQLMRQVHLPIVILSN